MIKNVLKFLRLILISISPPLIFLTLFFIGSMIIYKNLERDISWIDAFFWITHPHGISEHRKDITKIFAFVVYIGIFFFQVWFIERILANVFSGEIKTLWRKRMSEVAISRLKNHYIICGYGQVGRTVIDELIKLNLPFVLIEMNESLAKELIKEGINVIHGDARRRNILLNAGIKKAKVLCTLIDNDADNLYITITAKMLNPNIKVISRAGNLRYAEAMRGAGADEVIVPEYEAGMVVGRMISKYEKIKD